MLAAEDPDLVDRLLLLSYPLHPPGKPDAVAHRAFSEVATRRCCSCMAREIHSVRWMNCKALSSSIPAPVQLLEIEGAGHDLGRDHAALARRIVDYWLRPIR